jgi:hypothetical protein
MQDFNPGAARTFGQPPIAAADDPDFRAPATA